MNDGKRADRVTFHKINEVYSHIETSDTGILEELKEAFSFYAEGYKHMKAYKFGDWDGKIRFINSNGLVYSGLAKRIFQFCNSRDYDFINKTSVNLNFSEDEISEKIEKLNLTKTLRDYQLTTITKCFNAKKKLVISPTGSGKSLMIYSLIKLIDKPTLVIVPRINLVSQMYTDFIDYGMKPWEAYKIKAGVDKFIDHKIIITTWHSIIKLPKEWFDRFEVIIGDEAHGYKANSLIKIMQKTTSAEYKFGFTGTLSKNFTHSLTIEGLFGDQIISAKTKELIDQKILANLNIEVINFNYSHADRISCEGLSYQKETAFLRKHVKRLKYVAKLAASLPGNTLVLFWAIEHGKALVDKIKELFPNKKVELIYGKNDVEEREEIRRLMESSKKCIVIASTGIFSEGTNIININNIVFAHSFKTQIKVLQSIGRGLRRSANKTEVNLYDLADDLSTNDNINYTQRHLFERLKIYKEQEFKYRIHRIEL